MIIQTENTSTCQAACHFCVYPELGRYGGRMDMELFKKIVNECPEMGCRKFVINGLGEPLLDNSLEERVSYINRTLYGVPVEIFTNGQFLTPERFDALKKAGINSIVVSLNAVRPEQHEKIMGLKCFDTVCKNIEYAIKNAEHVLVMVHAVADGLHFVDEDARIFSARWGTNCKVFFMGNWAGEKEDHHGFDPDSYCSRSDRTMYITYDGKVTMCCFDPTGKTVFGDVNHQTLKEIHDGGSYARFREAHAANRATDYEQCATCSRI